MKSPLLPSLLHVFLIGVFGPIAGIILRWHYNQKNERETGSWFWYASWLLVLAAMLGMGITLGMGLGSMYDM